MFVYPDKIEAYTKRHNPIWTELQETLKQYGVSNYSIFLDKETNTLCKCWLCSKKYWNS